MRAQKNRRMSVLRNTSLPNVSGIECPVARIMTETTTIATENPRQSVVVIKTAFVTQAEKQTSP